MDPERRKHALRIGSNFLQLGAGFVMGLLVVRLLLGLGQEAYGVIAALTAGSGIAQLLREVTRAGLVPRLGAAWHSQQQAKEFPEVFRGALALGGIGGGLSLLAFGLVVVLLPWLDIPPALREASFLFLCWKAGQTVLALALGPFVTSLVVQERQATYNGILMLERAIELASACWVASAFGVDHAAEGIVAYGRTVTLANGMLQIAVASWQFWRVPMSRQAPWHASRERLRDVAGSFGWNAVQAVAMNFHLRLDILLSNAFLGLVPGLVFSLAGQAASYVRQLAMGVVNGLDAVSARQQSRGQDADLAVLTKSQTGLAAWIVIPTAAVFWVWAEDLLRWWLGHRLNHSDELLSLAAFQIRVLLIGVVVRSISEPWMAILSGAGQVKRYAPLLLTGSLVSPLLIVAGIAGLPAASWQWLIPGVFSGVLLVVHGIFLPGIVSKTVSLPWSSLYRPLLVPTMLSVAVVLGVWCWRA
ncbi:MAG: hypothetical protein IT576_02405 [Verrucomicrobiales bacterium]|nr:hypothetical protein [Verrucomicrobiales bacterium]